jgi:hypothetical protein
MTALGQTRWAIAEGYIPGQSSFSDPALVSHETACILNSGDQVGPLEIVETQMQRAPRRNVPRDTPYSSLFESDVPIVVQHTRLDSRHAEVSLLSTTAYAETAAH